MHVVTVTLEDEKDEEYPVTKVVYKDGIEPMGADFSTKTYKGLHELSPTEKDTICLLAQGAAVLFVFGWVGYKIIRKATKRGKKH